MLSIRPQNLLQIIGVSAQRTTVQTPPTAASVSFNGATFPGDPAAQVRLAGFHLISGIVAILPPNGSTYTFDSLEVEQIVVVNQGTGGFSTLQVNRSTFQNGPLVVQGGPRSGRSALSRAAQVRRRAAPRCRKS